jgi:hypothetical protein
MEFGLRFSGESSRENDWIVDAHRDGKHCVMRAEEKLMLNSNLVQGNPAQPMR